MLIGMPQRNLRHFSVDKVVPAAVFCECQINQALLLYLIRIFCGHLLHSVHTERISCALMVRIIRIACPNQRLFRATVRINQGTGLPLSVNHIFSSISQNKYDVSNIRKIDSVRFSYRILFPSNCV